MLDQVFDSYRKASESWLQTQQDTFRQLSQQWFAIPQNAAGLSNEWNRNFQKRWLELAVDMLNKHRESLDSMYKSGIHIVEQTFRVSEARSTEDYRRTVEELWRTMVESFKSQSEAQLRDFQSWTEKSMEIAQNAQA